MSDRFLVIIPSIRQDRPGFAEVQARVQATFTQPTEYHLLHGKDGKPAALNHALASLLPASDATIYVTMDDDYVPGAGWQELVVQAFQDLPRVGAASLWVGNDPELQHLIGAFRLDPPVTEGKTTYRKVQRGHHIAGALIAYRREVALAVGPQPITGEKYQVWEDAWRGRKVQSLGWDLAFLEGAEPDFIFYEDPAEYVKWREDQVVASRRNQDEYLRQSGIPDPWTLRLRRWVAKIRGRAP